MVVVVIMVVMTMNSVVVVVSVDGCHPLEANETIDGFVPMPIVLPLAFLCDLLLLLL